MARIALILFLMAAYHACLASDQVVGIECLTKQVMKNIERRQIASWLSGGQAHIYSFKAADQDMIVKCFKSRSDFVHEVHVLARLDHHPNILRPVAALHEFSALVYHKIRDGDLWDLDPIRKGLGYRQLVEICRQIILAVAAIHRVGFLHMDVKPENILRNGTHIYLTDLGLASERGWARKGTGTARTMAPEALLPSTAPLTEASDWWSVGVTIFYLFATFYELSNEMHYDHFPYQLVRDHQGTVVRLEWPPSAPLPFPPALVDLLYGPCGLLSYYYQLRLWPAGQVVSLLAHPFFLR